MNLLAHLRRLHAYEAWAGGLAAASLRTAENKSGGGTVPGTEIPFKRGVEVFAHIQSARHVWLSTLGAVEPRPFVMFPQTTIDEAERDAKSLDGLWAAYLAGLADTGLDEQVRRVRASGEVQFYRRADIIAHAVNHGSYHRGQIAVFVKQCGGTPEQTDLVRYAREVGGVGAWGG